MNWQSPDDLRPAAVPPAAAGFARAGAAPHPGAAAAAGGEEGWSIGEVQSRLGLSARTIRYYEELGLLPGVRRRGGGRGGRRIYGADELERLRFIQRLKAVGLSLAEIKELNAVYGIAGSTRAMLGRLEQLLDRHRAEVDARIAELETLREEIDNYRDHVGRRIEQADPGSGRADPGSDRSEPAMPPSGSAEESAR